MRKQESAVTVLQASSEVLSASGYRQVNKTYGPRHNEEKGTCQRCFDIMGRLHCTRWDATGLASRAAVRSRGRRFHWLPSFFSSLRGNSHSELQPSKKCTVACSFYIDPHPTNRQQPRHHCTVEDLRPSETPPNHAVQPYRSMSTYGRNLDA